MTKREKLREIFQRLKDGEILHVITEKGQTYQGLSFSMDESWLRCQHYGFWAHKATMQNLQYELDSTGSYEVESDTDFEKRTGNKFLHWGL